VEKLSCIHVLTGCLQVQIQKRFVPAALVWKWFRVPHRLSIEEAGGIDLGDQLINMVLVLLILRH